MALMIFGVAAVIGNGLGGLLTDRIEAGPDVDHSLRRRMRDHAFPDAGRNAALCDRWRRWRSGACFLRVHGRAARRARGARSAENVDIVRAQCFGHLSWRNRSGPSSAARRSNSSGTAARGPVGAMLALAALGSMAIVALLSDQRRLLA